MEDKKDRVYKAIMLVVLTAFVTFMITAFTMYSYYDLGNLAATDSKIELSDFIENNKDTIQDTNNKQSTIQQHINRVREVIDKYYLWKNEIDEDELKDAAIEGYVAGLNDEYTSYIPAKEMEKVTETITRKFYRYRNLHGGK